MIHEVMVLDHSGPAFGMILYGAALKLFVFAALVVRAGLPAGDRLMPWLDWPIFVGGMLAVAVADRRRGIDHGPPAADARSAPARRGLPVVGLWHHPAGEVNRWPNFSIPC